MREGEKGRREGIEGREGGRGGGGKGGMEGGEGGREVPHRPLMDKLASLHVDPYVLRWLSDYLCQHSQCVAVNGEFSTSSKVISGVPQGSVSGPLLFLIYINGISEVELHNGTIVLYADDILLHHRTQSQADYLLLQKDIDNIRLGSWQITWCSILASASTWSSLGSTSLYNPYDRYIYIENLQQTHLCGARSGSPQLNGST